LRRPRRRSENTGENTIRDERDGYVVDPHGKIRGEVRNYDPYSRFGEIMLYDIDSFGFISGYISKNWDVMSEKDILVDRKLASRLYETKYQIWKRYNVHELYELYEKRNQECADNFEKFCRDVFKRI